MKTEIISKNNLKNCILIALFSAIISICAFITIPATIPFTLQTFGIFCALTVLGGKNGLVSVLLYISLGIIGLPVFSGFSGGIGHLLGATGGYISGFIFTAVIYAIITKFFGNSAKTKVVGLILGLLACYVFGTFWYTAVYLGELNFKSFISSTMVCVVPFIIPDLIKMAAAILISEKLPDLKN